MTIVYAGDLIPGSPLMQPPVTPYLTLEKADIRADTLGHLSNHSAAL